MPRHSAGSSDGGGMYIHMRKRANYLNSAHHKRPKQAKLFRHSSSEAYNQTTRAKQQSMAGENVMLSHASSIIIGRS